MAYNAGHAGDLFGSLPCYTAAPIRWRSGLANNYGVVRKNEGYNLRNMVPWDRNWGRNDIASWGTGHERPYNIVDEAYTPHYTIEQLPSDYRFLPYFDELPVQPWQNGSKR